MHNAEPMWLQPCARKKQASNSKTNKTRGVVSVLTVLLENKRDSLSEVQVIKYVLTVDKNKWHTITTEKKKENDITNTNTWKEASRMRRFLAKNDDNT